MSVNTHGIRLRRGSRVWRSAVELLSAMRFAISLLTVICIASVIGTVLKQHEPVLNYVNQFGPFWARVFGSLSLFSVYSAWWFLLILGFLVVSTSLCISRTTPKIIAEWNALKENIRSQSLGAFAHRATGAMALAPQAAAERVGQALARAGWKVKLQRREGAADANGQVSVGWMVAAKAGGANKVGYIAAHSAIVLVCIGGLLDGDLFIRAHTWFLGKEVYTGGGLIADVPQQHRLSPSNPAYRANLLVTEGAKSSTAILNQPQGILLQDLPFSVELKKFIVEYYSTGMPKLFASEIVIHDRETGQKTPARVEVNHPASYKGVEIYQSSFDDGGSAVRLKALPLTAGGSAGSKPLELEGVIGSSSRLSRGSADADSLTVEYSALRVINVENFGAKDANASDGAVDVRKVDLRHSIESRLGAPNKEKTDKTLRNVGPSITYKLRDAAGQAKEFHNYMLPVDFGDGVPVFLMGVRLDSNQPFQYLRAPADEQDSLEGFTRLRAALQDPSARQAAVRRYASTVTDASRPEMAQQLAASAERALGLFAGVPLTPQPGPRASQAPSAPADKAAGEPATALAKAPVVSGLQAVASFIDQNVPEAEREKAGEVLVRILNGSLMALNDTVRNQAGLPSLAPQATATAAFMAQAVIALSDAALYPAPVTLQLTGFDHVQASVFQVARAPGQPIVYLGCLFLIIGVFCMLYVRERRLWVWVTPALVGGQHASIATMALSSNRQTLDVGKEFDALRQQLLDAEPPGPALGPIASPAAT